jgi:IS1 family transposase
MQWIWFAIDETTREFVGVYIGDRSRQGAYGLWQSLPAVRSSVCYLLYRFLGRISTSNTYQAAHLL